MIASAKSSSGEGGSAVRGVTGYSSRTFRQGKEKPPRKDPRGLEGSTRTSLLPLDVEDAHRPEDRVVGSSGAAGEPVLGAELGHARAEVDVVGVLVLVTEVDLGAV